MDNSKLEQMPFLEGDTIYLRALCETDAESDYPSWFNSSKVCQYNSHHRFPYTKEDSIAFIRKLADDRSRIIFAIVDKKTYKHIGNISLQHIDYVDRTAELAFIIGNVDYWGRGISTEAGLLVIAHGFCQLNLNRIYMGTAANNIGMIKVAEKLGFFKEGVKRQALYKSGEYVDLIDFGLLRSEWE